MTPLEDDRMALDLLIRGFMISRTIRLVADLAIADRITPDGKRNVTDGTVKANKYRRFLASNPADCVGNS
jgi:hypothetical protein